MGSINENRTPQGLKPSYFQLFTARLKPCPDTKPESIYSTNFRDRTLAGYGKSAVTHGTPGQVSRRHPSAAKAGFIAKH
jgi:hypothetical protein